MPETIGRYQILEELGRGQMGAVYRARDPQIDRVVAIKVILTQRLSPDELKQYKERFQREAQAAGRMSHPGIITVHDISEDDSGEPYLVMEFVEGTSLDRLLPAGAERWPLPRTLDLVKQVALALDYAHQRDVIHRDIKPANILVTPQGQAKIADFGVAKMLGTQTTQSGNLIGTPAFMSPEQFSGAAVDARSDLFSLGAVLYWMCTGEKPFPGDTLTAVSFKVVYAAPLPANQLNPSLPSSLVTALDRCLAKNPGGRYASCAALATDLEAIAAGRPIAGPPIVEPAGPASPGVDKTIAVGTPVPARAGAETATTVVRAAPVSVSSRSKLVARLTLAAVVLAGGGGIFWWWRAQEPAPTKQTLAPTASSTAGASKAGVPKAVGGGSSPSETGNTRPRETAGEKSPGPLGILNVICEHNFHIARLEILADERMLMETTLRGEKDLGIIPIFHGKWESEKPLAVGHHILRVRVHSKESSYSGEGTISGTFEESETRTLLIEFGSGSGVGMSKRKLALSWR